MKHQQHTHSGVVSYQERATGSAHWKIKLLPKPREEQKHFLHSLKALMLPPSLKSRIQTQETFKRSVFKPS